jgi:hypothetical protein
LRHAFSIHAIGVRRTDLVCIFCVGAVVCHVGDTFWHLERDLREMGLRVAMNTFSSSFQVPEVPRSDRSTPTASQPPEATGLVERARTRLRAHVPKDAAEALLLARANGLFDRLEAVSEGLRRVTRLQERILERLLPVVDDLGELVRHELNDARARRGLPPRQHPDDATPVVIEHPGNDDTPSEP